MKLFTATSALLLSLYFIPSQLFADIKVGAPLGLSGSIAELAADMKKGIELAVKHVNTEGGVLGQKLDMVYADSACNPDKAVDAVTTLVEKEKVVALVGPICSGATIRQALSVSIPASVVTLSVASASPMISTLRDKDLVFRTAVSDSFKGVAMAAFALENNIKEVAVSFASDAYNSSTASAFSTAYKSWGGKIVVNQAHQPDQSSYQREVSALTSGSRNLALFAYYGSSGITLLKDAFKSDSFDNVLGSDGMLAPETIEALGTENLKSTNVFSSSVDVEREAYKKWKELADKADVPAKGPFVANSYDAAMMMALAIQSSGSSERDRISAGLRAISGPDGETIYPGEFKKAMEILAAGGKINYDGASGPVDFDKNGDISGFVSSNHVENGEWKAELVRK